MFHQMTFIDVYINFISLTCSPHYVKTTIGRYQHTNGLIPIVGKTADDRTILIVGRLSVHLKLACMLKLFIAVSLSVCSCTFELVVACCQLNTVAVKSTSESLKKPLSSENHQTNAAAVSTVMTVSHSTAAPAAVASDANVSTLSLLSVGPYEDFAVSIRCCVCCFLAVDTLSVLSIVFPCRVIGMPAWICWSVSFAVWQCCWILQQWYLYSEIN